MVQYRKRVMKMCLLMYCLPTSQHTHTHTRAPTPTYTHSRTHTYIYTYTHIYIYIHAHTHIYIYTHTHNLAHLKTIFSLIRTSRMYAYACLRRQSKAFSIFTCKETVWSGDFWSRDWVRRRPWLYLLMMKTFRKVEGKWDSWEGRTPELYS